MIVSVSVFLLAQTSFAYLSLSETAELIKENHYRVGTVPQLLLANSGGSNAAVFFDFPVKNEMNSRIMIGSGSTDFWASSSIKWVPYPDYKTQPAIGVRGAFIYARDSANNFYNFRGINTNFYNFQLTPIVSKIIDTRWNKMNPYINLPLTIIYNSTRSEIAMQFVIGNEWLSRQDLQVGAELDLNLANTTTALTLHINFPFDKHTGFRQ